MAQEGKEISPEQRTWVRDYLIYHAKEVISTDPEAHAAAKELVDSLGGSPPTDNIQGWLESEPEAVEKVASEVVEQAEQTVETSEGKPESVEISDEIYAELGAALAADLNEIIARGEQEIMRFLADDDNGLCAGLSKQIVEELKQQDLVGADKVTLMEALSESAQQAMAEAFDGLCDALKEDGGYLWFFTREEAV